MKSLLFITLSALVLSCQQAEKPQQAASNTVVVADSIPSVSEQIDEQQDFTPDCDSKGNVTKRHEQNGAVLEQIRYEEASKFDGRAEFLKITVPNKPCKIMDISSFSHGGYGLQDWDEDGFLDLVKLNGRSGTMSVSLFDTKTNDFIEIEHVFANDIWDFDKAKGLKIEHFGKFEYAYYREDFKNVYNLYTIKQGKLIIVSSITFSIDWKDGQRNCVIDIKNNESKDPVKDAAFFDVLRKKAEAISPTRDDKSEGDYEAWINEAKPLVESYWRQKF